MSHKLKEEAKLERAIRGLLKLPENRRCINCNSIGPQYVCTTFWTFICTNCSGIHREFTHRVKSVSMAKFTSDEVTALQAGGNERAREIYFKEWDPHRNTQPDGSNPYKLRDFIKHVYVERRFTGEKGTENLSRLRLSDKEDSSETRRPNSCRIGLGSPSYEDRYERHYNSARSSPSQRSDDGMVRYYYDQSRSPRYTQHNSLSGGYKRSPARFEVVDDRFRDDGYGGGRRSGNGQRLTSDDFKFIRKKSTNDDLQKNAEKPSSASLEARLERQLSQGSSHSVGLRDRNEAKDAPQGPSNVQQKVTSPRSKSTSSEKSEAKQEKTAADKESLIVCNADSNPPDVQRQVSTAATATNNRSNWAPFESKSEEKKVEPATPAPNTLEFLLSELAGPLALPALVYNEVLTMTDQISVQQNVAQPDIEKDLVEAPPRVSEPETVDSTPGIETCPDASIERPTVEVSGDAAGNGADLMQITVYEHHHHHHHQPPASALAEDVSLREEAIPQNPAPWVEENIQQQPATSPYPTQNVDKPEPGMTSLSALQSPQPEAKLDGRKELPADIFTSLYSQAPAPVQAWQPPAPQGYGYNMQYYPPNMMTQLGAYSNSPKSTNPFDVGGDATEPQGSMFPSNAPFQGPFGFGPHSSYVQPLQPQAPAHGPAFSSGVYVGQQQGHINMPFPSSQQPHEFEYFVGNPNHQPAIGYSEANSSHYSSSSYSPVKGGNPFG